MSFALVSRARWSAAGLACAAVLASSVAQADDPPTAPRDAASEATGRALCADDSGKGQDLRDAGKLLEARQKFLVCAQDTCPITIRRDCVEWLKQTEISLPTVVLGAVGPNGEDVVAANVSYDGVLLTTQLDGNAFFVDTGTHTFRFEIPGKTPVETVIVIREGEKNRQVTASFREAVAAPPADSAPPRSNETASRSKVPAYVVGGAGVVAIGVGAVFWGVGLGERSTLKTTCGIAPPGESAGTCSDSQIASSRDKLIVGDILAGAGIVALGVATYLFITESSSHASDASTHAVSFDVKKTPSGAAAMLDVRF